MRALLRPVTTIDSPPAEIIVTIDLSFRISGEKGFHFHLMS